MTRTRSMPLRTFSHPPVNTSGDDAERKISHFIPSVELKGSRAEKLDTLDTLIRYLYELRRGLAGEPAGAAVIEGPSPYADRPAWPWFAAGTLTGALLLLLMLAARSCA